jgi:tetratricopeptide (TPR) repeat protein
MRITAQLVNAADGYQLWSERFDRDSTDVFAVQDEIARTVTRTLTDTLAGAYRTLDQTSRPANFDAYSAYLKGRHQWSRRTEAGLTRSLDYFQEAIGIDAAYAPAWAALADSYVTLAIYGVRAPAEVMPRARDAAERALGISAHQASAHASIACVEALHDWAWDRADHSFARALAIDPNLAVASQWRAMHHLLPLGRFDEAIAALIRAQELDPLSPAISASLALCAAFAGQQDRALGELDRALHLDADTPLLHYFKGRTLADGGDHDGALRSFDAASRAGGGGPELVGAIGYSQARRGDRAAAQTALQELTALAASRYVSPVSIAQVHVGLDEPDAANDALERAADLRATDLVWIAVRPLFRPLFATPRFQAVLARMGLGTSRA